MLKCYKPICTLTSSGWPAYPVAEGGGRRRKGAAQVFVFLFTSEMLFLWHRRWRHKAQVILRLDYFLIHVNARMRTGMSVSCSGTTRIFCRTYYWLNFSSFNYMVTN